jgi:hypothetical protein
MSAVRRMAHRAVFDNLRFKARRLFLPWFDRTLAMKTERFESHHEAAQALVLSVAGGDDPDC